MLDANRMVGAGGLNQAVPRYPVNSGNLIISGNVGGGRAFQGYSPIADPSALRVGLGSTTLDGFRRQTLSYSQMSSGYNYSNYAGTPFFSRTRTIANVGLLGSNQTLPGSSVVASPDLLPRINQFGVRDTTPGFTPAQDRRVPGTISTMPPPSQSVMFQVPIAGGADNATWSIQPLVSQSPIFGLRSNVLAPGDQVETELSRAREDVWRREGNLAERTARLPVSRLPEGTPDASQYVGVLDTPTGEEGSLLEDAWQFSSLDEAPPDSATPADGGMTLGAHDAVRRGPGAAGSDDGSLFSVGGANTFADIYAAVRTLRMLQRRRAGTDQQEDASRQQATVRALTDYFGSPISTFVGSEASPINSLMGQAEELLRQGAYYRAASRYESARAVDPRNPLPYLGRGHALFTAGEYVSAVVEVQRGIDRYPEIGYFSLDLQALIDDPDVFDRRRADLENRLEMRENYRLRFLLGYVEYYGGFPEIGIEDLKKAAAAAPPDSIIARFPKQLEEAKTSPLLKD